MNLALKLPKKHKNHTENSNTIHTYHRPLKKGQRSLKLGNGEYISIMTVELVELWLKTLRLQDHLFIPDLRGSWFMLVFYGT